MSKKIKILFPDGRSSEFNKGISGYEIAMSISQGLARNAFAVKIDDILCDLSLPINQDSSIKIIKKEDNEALELIRHDCAHVMAEAVQELFPNTQVTIGPAIENGFYYDFSRKEGFTDSDLEKIEKKMIEIINKGEKFKREIWSRDKAYSYFNKINEIYKSDIIKDLPKKEKITIYKQGKWLDLCRGPHLPTTKHIGKSFKLMKISGAYWRGDENNEMLTRIYGTAWRNDKELNKYLEMLSEAEKRDHRKIGKKNANFYI